MYHQASLLFWFKNSVFFFRMSIGGSLIFLGEFPENREQFPTGDVLTVMKKELLLLKFSEQNRALSTRIFTLRSHYRIGEFDGPQGVARPACRLRHA
jgi:hypothetical protein